MVHPVAVHNRKNSFSDRWIDQLRKRGLEIRIVSCYSNTIFRDLAGCNALLWHWTQDLPKDLLVARHILQTAESRGIKVFPNLATCWHFDDKVAQKYLLESLNAPLVPTHVFFDKQAALDWVTLTSWPKVFKLRRGAGSRNVRLVRGPDEARELIHRAFGRGFKPYASPFRDISTQVHIARQKDDFGRKLRRFPNAIWTIWTNNRLAPREKGYVYFQDFLPNNLFDTRVTVIGERAFAFTRSVRPGDFRASGSGLLDYDRSKIDPACVEAAFRSASGIGAQSIAFDFLFDEQKQPKIVEVSYCYMSKAVHDCSGYWDPALNWHDGHVWPEDAILDDILAGIDTER